MNCLSPLSIPRPNGGGAKDRLTVPCGKCLPCLSARRQMWSFRLNQELKVAETAYFVTLTYDDENLPTINKEGIIDSRYYMRMRYANSFLSDFIRFEEENKPTVCKDDIQKFLKRLRKQCVGSKIRYFVVSEYGSDTKRPHYHGIFFNLPISSDEFHTNIVGILNFAWKKGFVSVGTVTPASIMYCAKYCLTKQDVPEGALPPFLFCHLGLEKIIYLMKSGYIMRIPEITMS